MWLFPIAAVLGLLFSSLGLYTAIKSKKPFLRLTGISAAVVLPSVILHNLVSALGIYLNLWQDEAFFFILGLVIAPITFIIGVVGALVKKEV